VHGRTRGSQVVQIKIKYPKKLDQRQKELLNELGESFGEEHTMHESRFDELVSNIKKWFK
jgi:molecular chaperone DnaJ